MIGPDWTTGNTLGVVGVDEWLSPPSEIQFIHIHTIVEGVAHPPKIGGPPH